MCVKAILENGGTLKSVPGCYKNQEICHKAQCRSCNEMGILKIDVTNMNLDNTFDEDANDTIIHIRLLAWHVKFEKRKALKEINEELIPVA